MKLQRSTGRKIPDKTEMAWNESCDINTLTRTGKTGHSIRNYEGLQ